MAILTKDLISQLQFGSISDSFLRSTKSFKQAVSAYTPLDVIETLYPSIHSFLITNYTVEGIPNKLHLLPKNFVIEKNKTSILYSFLRAFLASCTNSYKIKNIINCEVYEYSLSSRSFLSQTKNSTIPSISVYDWPLLFYFFEEV